MVSNWIETIRERPRIHMTVAAPLSDIQDANGDADIRDRRVALWKAGPRNPEGRIHAWQGKKGMGKAHSASSIDNQVDTTKLTLPPWSPATRSSPAREYGSSMGTRFQRGHVNLFTRRLRLHKGCRLWGDFGRFCALSYLDKGRASKIS